MKRRSFITLLGGAAATSTWPLAVRAQQQSAKIARIGYWTFGTAAAAALRVEAMRAGLRELGYVEGRNLIFESRSGEGKFEDLPALVAELVSMNVDVIVVFGPGPIAAAKAATSKIPIVMIAGSSDPVGEGLIASFARPGGNITGLTYAASSERFGKQLELLKEAVGQVSRVGVLWDLDIEQFRRAWAPALQQAGGQLGLQIEGPFLVRGDPDFEPAFAAMIQRSVEAVLVAAGGSAYASRARVAELAMHNRLPIMAAFREFPQTGSLMSYGPDFFEVYHRAATYVHKILKGDKPGELPVEQPTKYQLVINLKTAKALGLTVSPSLLARADEVIE